VKTAGYLKIFSASFSILRLNHFLNRIKLRETMVNCNLSSNNRVMKKLFALSASLRRRKDSFSKMRYHPSQ